MNNFKIDFEFVKKNYTDNYSFWDKIRMISTDRPLRFIIEGCGQVFCCYNTSMEIPIVLYDDGYAGYALQRDEEQVEALGYVKGSNTVAFGNFIHEAIHLYLSWKLDFVGESVGYRQSIGEEFLPKTTNQADAINEELLVIGFQIRLNGVTTETVKGFNFFLAEATARKAEADLQICGYRIDQLIEEFIEIFQKSNKGFRLDS